MVNFVFVVFFVALVFVQIPLKLVCSVVFVDLVISLEAICAEPLDLEFTVFVKRFFAFHIDPTPTVIKACLFAFGTFLESVRLELLADCFDLFCDVLCEAFAVKAVAFGNVAENILLLHALLRAILADLVSVKFGVGEVLAFVQNDVLEFFRRPVFCHAQESFDVLVVGHRKRFGVSERNGAVLELFKRFAAKPCHFHAADHPARVASKMACDRVDVVAIVEHLCDRHAFVGGVHVLARDVLGRGNFEGFLVVDFADIAGNLRKVQVLQCGKTAGACDHLVALADGSHGNRLNQAVGLDACFQVAHVADFGARVLRVLIDKLDVDQLVCFGCFHFLCSLES